jgi:hypothetical protein
MLEAIDRWENEGGAAPLMHPPQPLINEGGDAQAATACHATSNGATPADYAQTGPEHPAPVTPGPSAASPIPRRQLAASRMTA